ncbi:MAG: TonB-dependent receptor [Bacteroidales bacterium]
MIRKSKTLILAGLLILAALPGFNQSYRLDTARFSIEEVTIMAYRIPQNPNQFTHITRIISKQEIEAAPVRDLAELLRYLPDIDVRQRGPIGVQSDISLRGGTFDQFAILINGINFSDPQTGHFHMDIPIPLNLIQRIEVLSGSDVKSLGSNAFTGAINIVTGAPENKALQAGLSVGQNGFFESGISARNHFKKWWEQAGILYQKSDGYRENTDFKHLNGFFQTGYSIRRFNVNLMAGGLSKAFGANSFYTAKYPDQFEKTGSAFTALQAAYSGKVNLRQSLFYRLHTDEFSLFRTDPPAWYVAPNYHLTQTDGSKTDAWFTSALGKTALGFEYRHETIWSTVLGEISGTQKDIPGIAGIRYNHYGSRSHFSLTVEQQVETGRIKWNGGVVFHKVQSVKNYFQVYPGLDISYAASKALKTFISFNRAFRLPTFTELYYKSPVNQGNAALLPETAWHSEAGADYHLHGFSARISGFYRYATQSIDWVRTASETVWHTENLGKIKTYGVETGISWSPAENKILTRFIDRFDLGYRHYFQHHTVDSYYSQYVLDYLKWKMSAGLTVNIWAPLRFTANLVWQERNGTYTAFDASQNMIEVDYKPFMVADVKLTYTIRWITLIGECSNLFNREYFDLSSVPMPGAWYKVGLEFNLVGKH